MSLLKLRTYPDPVLKRQAAPHQTFGPLDQKLFDDMIETMYRDDGVGLAAPQVGISKRIFVCSPRMTRGEEYVMVNPVIEKATGAAVAAEGCLSLPGISADVERATEVRLTYQDRSGRLHRIEVYDFFARVVQHEMDHLNGKLLIDHFTGKKREELLGQYEKTRTAGDVSKLQD
ncbi:MAG: Peptide deformylase 1 [Candidatus Omnitrophica bacterium ADurb.Bin292]|nr:MAG: Peptide deformylase 1 [Candidatus Omnitrophica bacterium ADurb.Bin292]HOG24054.1 peptide deformylase [Candidatus Omnitrophota bacterium]